MAKKSELMMTHSEEPKQILEHDYSRSGMVNPLYPMAPHEFSGVTRSLQCCHNQGHSEFHVVTLYVESGKVVKIERSDSYKIWEAIDRMTRWNESACLHLNQNWKLGKTLSK
jgi:hypothetical protein